MSYDDVTEAVIEEDYYACLNIPKEVRTVWKGVHKIAMQVILLYFDRPPKRR
jgi:hypothetical protein